jgi:phospholipase C
MRVALELEAVHCNDTIEHSLRPGENFVKFWNLERSFAWYDFTIEVDSDPDFRQRITGHVETGKDSMSDSAIGMTKTQ